MGQGAPAVPLPRAGPRPKIATEEPAFATRDNTPRRHNPTPHWQDNLLDLLEPEERGLVLEMRQRVEDVIQSNEDAAAHADAFTLHRYGEFGDTANGHAATPPP